jgi:type II secretory pathway predicted ATPase ExeA
VLSEVMAHYGLARPFHDAGWFETEHHRQVGRTLAWAVAHRRLIAVAGLVGSGPGVRRRDRQSSPVGRVRP